MRKLKLRYYKASGIYIAKNKPFENKSDKGKSPN